MRLASRKNRMGPGPKLLSLRPFFLASKNSFQILPRTIANVASKCRNVGTESFTRASLPMRVTEAGIGCPDFSGTLLILCDFLGREPIELLGDALATEAIQTTTAAANDVRTQVLDAISKCKKAVMLLSDHDVQALREADEPKHATYVRGGIVKKASCPACDSFGRLAAKDIGDRPAQALDGKICVETNYSPRLFKCGICGLELNSVAELQIAGLADHFSQTSEYDPAEYFDIKTYGPEDDYMNE